MPEVLAAMAYQAEKMRKGMSEQIREFWPTEDDPDLVVTGFVLRPASDEDLIEDEGEEVGLYVFEAHFFASNHPTIGNASSSLHLRFDEVESYQEAINRFIQEVSRDEGYISKKKVFVD